MWLHALLPCEDRPLYEGEKTPGGRHRFKDYILARIFHIRASPVSLSFGNQQLCVSEEALQAAREEAKQLPGSRKVEFVPNMFPYQVCDGTQHYVLWFLLNPSVSNLPTEQDINAALEREFTELEVADQVEFVWYKNPKPTIHDLDLTHHVQVFWRLVPKS